MKEGQEAEAIQQTPRKRSLREREQYPHWTQQSTATPRSPEEYYLQREDDKVES